MTSLGRSLERSRTAQLAEIVCVFASAAVIIAVGWKLVGDSQLARQGVAWVANVVMLALVWIGLRVRGQDWKHFGLNVRYLGLRALGKTVLQSLLVLAATIVAFLVASILMTNLAGQPESADMSGYNYLQGNLPMLLLALAGVYIVSSFGEEVIFRGFLINRLAEFGHGGKNAWRIAALISSVIFGLAHFAWGTVGIV